MTIIVASMQELSEKHNLAVCLQGFFFSCTNILIRTLITLNAKSKSNNAPEILPLYQQCIFHLEEIVP